MHNINQQTTNQNKPMTTSEPPDDTLALLAYHCLEDLATDDKVDEKLRTEARMAQNLLSGLEWDHVANHAFLCKTICKALLKHIGDVPSTFGLKCETDGFVGMQHHLIGDIRSMMGDVVCWQKKKHTNDNNNIK